MSNDWIAGQSISLDSLIHCLNWKIVSSNVLEWKHFVRMKGIFATWTYKYAFSCELNILTPESYYLASSNLLELKKIWLLLK